MSSIKIIFAVNENNDFCNKDGTQLPWDKNKKDLEYFKNITSSGCNGYVASESKNVIIMGRKTFNSLKNKPLKYRTNIIVSRTLSQNQNNFGFCFDDCIIKSNLYDAIKVAKQITTSSIFIIGGIELIKEALSNLYIS